MSSWATLALTTVTAALLAVPVAPALYELWKREDAAPLPTSRHDGRIANFADVFRSRLEPLRPRLERCRAQLEISRARVDGIEVLLVGCNAEDFDFDPSLVQGIAAVMFSRAALIPAGRVVDADIYADAALELEEGAALRAAVGRSDITLGKDSGVLRWLHADGGIYLRRGSSAYGRLSAGQSIRMEPGCGFQRMHAPSILTVDAGQDGDCVSVPSTAHVCETSEDAQHLPADRGEVFASSRPRLRVKGNFVLAPGETLNANVITTGELQFGAGARLFGSVKSYRGAELEEGSCVHGSIVCGGTLRLGPRSFVTGPIMAEGDVLVARGCRVGEPDALTTISSSGTQIAPGCQLHGTVWARVRGSVED
jgi:hypothetical protein